MNFLYFAYGVGLLVAMNIILLVLTLMGHQFLEKSALENIILIMFFCGLVIIGIFITRKAPEGKILNALLLSLMLVAIMGGFIFMSGFIPQQFNLFLLGSLLCFIVGIGFQCFASKKFK